MKQVINIPFELLLVVINLIVKLFKYIKYRRLKQMDKKQVKKMFDLRCKIIDTSESIQKSTQDKVLQNKLQDVKTMTQELYYLGSMQQLELNLNHYDNGK